ncbi:MAG TPA: antitoxin Xre/MbcA/ParS toxin-binding domain-containing protein [Burkholderiaceae bacterium]|nr:antitoxin Xre/MbcA/ParS toxin-binding domain-containing protein [Burkholderiaceae bacterium]
MQLQPRPARLPAPVRFPPQQAPLGREGPQAFSEAAVSDAAFLALLDAYRASGGVARAAEVAAWVERGPGRGTDLVQRWRADRSVICFAWQATTWLPRFQFARAGLLPDAAVRVALAELRAVFDEAETAQWFATPNSALGGYAPVALIRRQPLTVIRAARRDRFIADG